MRNIKITIGYDGTSYYGWQKQPNVVTIQGEIEKALKRVTGENILLIGASRTDKRVHGRGQVANFFTNSVIPDYKFKDALNVSLPEDIVILKSCEVEEKFHSRFSAKGKKYRYLIYNNSIRNPLFRNYSYHVPWKLDIESMKRALSYFVGTHDFSAFMNSKNQSEITVRTINGAKIIKKNRLIHIIVEGDGFLYNMVRIIVGTLIDVGRGKICEDEVLKIIKSKDRKQAGHTAPPQGLYLEKIFY